MTKVIDRLARREGRGFMTALGRQPGARRLRELLSTLVHASDCEYPSPLVLWNEQVTKKISRDL